MSTTWREKYFERIDCKGVAINEGTGDITIQGEVKTKSENPTVVYWAPNPPTYSTSYSGSALPYHDSIQAYDNTPNIGAVRAENKSFKFQIKYPNSYYVGLGSLYVSPHVHFKICEETDQKSLIENIKNNSNNLSPEDNGYHTIQIDEGIPFRTLTYPAPPSNNPRISPMFYHCHRNQMPIRGQETILRDSGFPEVNVMPKNFWGLKPPQ